MNRRAWILSSLTLACCAVSPSFAHTIKYAFTFSGLNENPQVITGGTGKGLVTFDLDMVTMRVQAEFSGLTGTTTAAHIHCCDFNPITGNAGVATTSPNFTGFPTGVTAGTYDHTFDMTATSSYRNVFLAANGGSVANALSSLLAGLASGQAYFNIHTNAFPPGEIRGNPTLVPEPSSALLALAGLGLPFMFRRLR